MDGTIGRRYAQGRRGENEGEPVTWRRTTERDSRGQKTASPGDQPLISDDELRPVRGGSGMGVGV
jgi:hypothetical protein